MTSSCESGCRTSTETPGDGTGSDGRRAMLTATERLSPAIVCRSSSALILVPPCPRTGDKITDYTLLVTTCICIE